MEASPVHPLGERDALLNTSSFVRSGTSVQYTESGYRFKTGNRVSGRMLKNDPLMAEGALEKTFRFLYASNPQTLGALRGLCGLSLSMKLEFQRPAGDVVKKSCREDTVVSKCSYSGPRLETPSKSPAPGFRPQAGFEERNISG